MEALVSDTKAADVLQRNNVEPACSELIPRWCLICPWVIQGLRLTSKHCNFELVFISAVQYCKQARRQETYLSGETRLMRKSGLVQVMNNGSGRWTAIVRDCRRAEAWVWSVSKSWVAGRLSQRWLRLPGIVALMNIHG